VCFSLALPLGEEVAEYLTFFLELDKSDDQWSEDMIDSG
jgi:hypothetical protein